MQPDPFAPSSPLPILSVMIIVQCHAFCLSCGVGFVVKGPTPDQYKALSKYRVLLAPLRVGAGVKGKIADAWW